TRRDATGRVRAGGSDRIGRIDPRAKGSPMTVEEEESLSGRLAGPRRAGRGGAAARRALRAASGPGPQMPYIRRRIGVYAVLDEEGLALIEANADRVLEEIGIEFRGDG